MNWICDYCSTSNENEIKECFVCGRSRSEASILESRRKQREHEIEKINSYLYRTIFSRIKYIFLTLIIVSVILISILGTILVVNETIDEPVIIASKLLDYIYKNAIKKISDNSLFVFDNIISTINSDFQHNLDYIFVICTDKHNILRNLLFEPIFIHLNKNMTYITDMEDTLYKLLVKNLSLFGSIVRILYNEIRQTVTNFILVVISIFNNMKSNFL